jgi:hypothetical protein
MKRRDFLLLPGVIAMAWNQASAKVETPRIGFVQAGSRQENHALLVAFRDGLSALGWTDGSNVPGVRGQRARKEDGTRHPRAGDGDDIGPSV